MKNKLKMIISSTIAIIFTTITLGLLIIWIFHLYPTSPGPVLNYFGSILFYGLITTLFWLVTRGYYLDLKEEKRENKD